MRLKRMPKLLIIAFYILVFITPFHAAASTDLPDSHHIGGVPLVDQGDKPWCGPGSVVMILQYWHFDVTLKEVGEEIDSEEDGCYPYELVEYLDDFELRIYKLDSMTELKNWISRNHPVIICQWTDERKESGHYRVVIGYDLDYIYVNDPNGFRDKLTYELFLLLWTKYNEYGLTISPVKSFINDPHNRTINIEGGV